MPFDESKLTKPAREWLDDHFDRPATPGLPDDTRSDWLAKLLASQVEIASRLAEAGQPDDMIEKNLRDRLERDLVILRQRPGYHRGQGEFWHEVVGQAVAAVVSARRRAVRLVEAEDQAAAAAVETSKQGRMREALRRMTGTA
jgi:hypothetical protein